MGRIFVSAEPHGWGWTIAVNEGEPRALSDAINIDVQPGRHQLTATNAKGFSETRTLVIPGGEPTWVRFKDGPKPDPDAPSAEFALHVTHLASDVTGGLERMLVFRHLKELAAYFGRCFVRHTPGDSPVPLGLSFGVSKDGFPTDVRITRGPPAIHVCATNAIKRLSLPVADQPSRVRFKYALAPVRTADAPKGIPSFNFGKVTIPSSYKAGPLESKFRWLLSSLRHCKQLTPPASLTVKLRLNEPRVRVLEGVVFGPSGRLADCIEAQLSFLVFRNIDAPIEMSFELLFRRGT